MRLTSVAIALVLAGCGAPEYGPLPARCSDGVCPDGYACIHGVCAAPGTPVPITIAGVESLRGTDLKLVPQSGGVLVTWETYAYSPEGQRFRAARVAASGEVSAILDLVTSFVADEGALEPYFDVLPISDEELLLSVSASPLPDDEAPDARLLTYRIDLPPAGQEGRGVQFAAAWDAEERMDTAGYGAVSRPRLIPRSDHVELGYVRTRVDAGGTGGGGGGGGGGTQAEVIGELVVFSLGLDGAMLGPPATYRVRDGLTVAVGVDEAFPHGNRVFWVLDDVRPSAVLVEDAAQGANPHAEIPLERLGAAVDATDASLLYLEPSARTGDKLPTDPVAGDAVLHRVDASPAAGDPPFSLSEQALGELGAIRDTPRAAWIAREGRSALLVTPGAAIDAPALAIYEVDPETGATADVARIERFSTAQLDVVRAALVGGNLYVAWSEGSSEASTVRIAIVPEP